MRKIIYKLLIWFGWSRNKAKYLLSGSCKACQKEENQGLWFKDRIHGCGGRR